MSNIRTIAASWVSYQASQAGLPIHQRTVRTYQRNDYALHGRAVLPSQMDTARKLAGSLSLV